ncbi:uncharacterized protein LOC143915675 isoform X1 [Arctopsyche grandis]|uniref:uncharacterized protein LOC143915675 isoform X1 n=1 Tax=Arctopsyche grandis TaxID=121162 RepID=UPI00406D7854
MTRWLCLLLLSVLVVQVAYSHPRVRRQIELQDSENLTPVDDEVAGDDADRDKRNLEGATQAKYGAKNAILGFVFGKINQLIDSKTRFIDQLDKQNIVQNKMYGIEAPGSPAASLGSVFSSIISPKINAFTGLLGGLSGGSSGGHDGGSGGSGLGSILRIFTSLSGSSSGGGGGGGGGTLTISDSSDSHEDDDDDSNE